MNVISPWLTDPIAAALGLVLLHFLWQGAVIAAGLAVVLKLGESWSAAARHRWSCAALGLLLAAPALTFGWILAAGAAPEVAGPALAPSGTGLTSPLPADAARSPEGASLRWLAGLAWCWGAGVLALGARLAGGWWQTRRLVSRDANPVPEGWQERTQRRCVQLRLRRPVRVVESWRVASPIVIGWLRPVILLPVGLLTRLPTAQVEAILLHELAHIRGNDHLINWIQRLAETLLFYHPAVWWVSEQIRREREHRCDDVAAEAMGEGRSLAGALLSLAEAESSLPELALAAEGASVAERIRRLLQATPAKSTALKRASLWLIVGAMAIAAALWAIPSLSAPKLFQSTVRVRVEPGGAPGATGYDPYFLAMQVERARSDEVLRSVLSGWRSDWKWGDQKNIETVAQLRDRLRVRQVRDTSVVEITAAHEDRALANWLAVRLAEEWGNRQLENTTRNYDMSTAEMARREHQLDQMLSSAIERLAKFTEENAEALKQGEPRAEVQQGLLNDEISVLRELKTKARRESLSRELEGSAYGSPIEIIDSGAPGARPVRWRP